VVSSGNPVSHVAEGAIQKEVLARDIAAKDIAKVDHMFPACMTRNKAFLIG